jgi:hypothetical protein
MRVSIREECLERRGVRIVLIIGRDRGVELLDRLEEVKGMQDGVASMVLCGQTSRRETLRGMRARHHLAAVREEPWSE